MKHDKLKDLIEQRDLLTQKVKKEAQKALKELIERSQKAVGGKIIRGWEDGLRVGIKMTKGEGKLYSAHVWDDNVEFEIENDGYSSVNLVRDIVDNPELCFACVETLELRNK